MYRSPPLSFDELDDVLQVLQAESPGPDTIDPASQWCLSACRRMLDDMTAQAHYDEKQGEKVLVLINHLLANVADRD